MRSESPTGIDYQAYPVLYVDDEVENLRTFELAFRRDFTVVRATSGTEALEILATQPVAVVLSDHRMPGMTGTDLLTRVREVAPKTIRLLVTAYGDAATLAQAINDGCIYRYVPKPWDVDEMRTIVRQAIDLSALEAQRESLVAELMTINGVSQKIAGQPELGPLVECILDAVVTDLGYDGASLLSTNDRGELCWFDSSPRVPEMAGGALVLSPSGSAELLRSLVAGHSTLLRLEEGFNSGEEIRGLLTSLSAEEVLVVPMQGRRGLIGAMLIDNRRGGGCFGAGSRRLLQGLAAQAAVAVDNAQLIGELRNDVARTSGADGLAIGAALGESMIPPARDCLEKFQQERGDAADERGELNDAVAAIRVIGEILAEQQPIRCDLGERIRTALDATRHVAEANGVRVSVARGDSLKVDALPGRLLQLLIHIAEIGTLMALGKSVAVSWKAQADAALVEFSSATASGDDSRDCSGDTSLDAGDLRVAACVALAKEAGGSMELMLGGPGRRIRLWLPMCGGL